MVFEIILIYVVVFALGFVFQALLPGNIRMLLIYPLSFVLGILTIKLADYNPLAFNLGMISRAAVGSYWMCVLLEAALLVAGLVVGFLI